MTSKSDSGTCKDKEWNAVYWIKFAFLANQLFEFFLKQLSNFGTFFKYDTSLTTNYKNYCFERVSLTFGLK